MIVAETSGADFFHMPVRHRVVGAAVVAVHRHVFMAVRHRNAVVLDLHGVNKIIRPVCR